jgi:hypothetical protein
MLTPSDQVAEALRAFAGLPRVSLEEPAFAATALDWMVKGMDFADALHLAKAEGSGPASFDAPLCQSGSVRKARQIAANPLPTKPEQVHTSTGPILSITYRGLVNPFIASMTLASPIW